MPDWLDLGDGFGIDMAEVVATSRTGGGGMLFHLQGHGEELERHICFGAEIVGAVQTWLGACATKPGLSCKKDELAYHTDFVPPPSFQDVWIGMVDSDGAREIVRGYYSEASWFMHDGALPPDVTVEWWSKGDPPPWPGTEPQSAPPGTPVVYFLANGDFPIAYQTVWLGLMDERGEMTTAKGYLTDDGWEYVQDPAILAPQTILWWHELFRPSSDKTEPTGPRIAPTTVYHWVKDGDLPKDAAGESDIRDVIAGYDVGGERMIRIVWYHPEIDRWHTRWPTAGRTHSAPVWWADFPSWPEEGDNG